MSKNDNGVRNTKLIMVGLFVTGISFGALIFWQALVSYELMDGEPFIDIGNAEAYGTFGDFVGGTLNPIFAFLTFLGLLYTIFMQSKELQYTREELRRSASAFEQQNFDNTFFNLMKMLSEAVDDASYEIWEPPMLNSDFINQAPRTNNVLHGHHAFNAMLENIKDIDLDGDFENRDGLDHNTDEWACEFDNFLYRYGIHDNLKPDYDYRILLGKYEAAKIHQYYQENSYQFGHYFRVLYNTLRLIDEDCEVEKCTKYVRLLRANITESELGLIFYNCLTKNGENLKVLVEKFGILDNLNLSSLIREETITQFDTKAFGGNIAILVRYTEFNEDGINEEPFYVENNLGKFD
ncbi:putative phage abortive infection protein [Terasakiella sp. A23]|uniref:putative phage abortive infection protein n=1 Tax=Terasakiella sp. FCG-A23 TaxID=3080561 RepID=UPI002955791A|nr:putative phage abortive infection protein [Terasakiella sp. A23]MDV7341810.1 putative phage abortive infection protein [Terasakiella sp. A23]